MFMRLLCNKCGRKAIPPQRLRGQGELMCRRHLFKSQGTDDYLLTAVVSILKNPKVSCIRKINSLFRCLRYCFQPFFTFYLFILSRIPLVTRHMFAEMLLHFTSFRSSFKEGCSKGSPPNIRTTWHFKKRERDRRSLPTTEGSIFSFSAIGEEWEQLLQDRLQCLTALISSIWV